jgi:hypothetical protein
VLRAWSKHYPRWVHSARALVADEKWMQLEPPLIRELEDAVRSSRSNPDWGVPAEVVKFRLMCLAFRLGTYLELPEDEVLHLIALAEESNGDIYRRRVSGAIISTIKDRLLPLGSARPDGSGESHGRI